VIFFFNFRKEFVLEEGEDPIDASGSGGRTLLDDTIAGVRARFDLRRTRLSHPPLSLALVTLARLKDF
jgi:hypothetical protein